MSAGLNTDFKMLQIKSARTAKSVEKDNYQGHGGHSSKQDSTLAICPSTATNAVAHHHSFEQMH